MIYNFQLHRITVVLIVALLGVGAGLCFFSGLLVGVSWQLEAQSRVATSADTASGKGNDGPEVTPQNLTLPGQTALPQLPPKPALAAPTLSVPGMSAPSPSAPALSFPAVTAPSPAATGSEEPAPLSPDAVTVPGRPEPATEAGPAVLAAAPAPVPTAAADPLRGLRKETPQEGFALQVGAFSQSENSQKLVAELAARGFEPYLVRTSTRGHLNIESVRIGRFTSRAEAAAAGQELARAEGIAAFVVRASGVVH